MSSSMLEVKNLSKRFGNFTAVKNLNFSVSKGEIFGFLGPNGAGKSTTMRIITCFIPPSEGTVHVDGLDIRQHDLEIRKRIGFLPEHNPLYADMKVKEYLKFVGEIRSLTGTTLSTALDKMITVCGLSSMVNREIGKLSKGYRQRVGLAQAMIHNPDLLILDEPVSGLDPNQIVEIRNLIREIGREKTVIYCSHILPEVKATCSRIMIINDGQIVAAGTADELTAADSSKATYSLRIQAAREQITDSLQSIEGVASATIDASSSTDGTAWHSVTINSDTSEDLGEKLFDCAVKNNWRLAELSKSSVSLEDVFTRLTRG